MMSKCVWALLNEEITDLIAAAYVNDPKEWILFMMENLEHSHFIKLLVGCWAIWHARRKAINEQVFQIPLSTHGFI
uniref:Uncharacterized protein n=1 Tax=Arundo donax TaxID=35708 RepID=A0A0A9AJ35_ARUDO